MKNIIYQGLSKEEVEEELSLGIEHFITALIKRSVTNQLGSIAAIMQDKNLFGNGLEIDKNDEEIAQTILVQYAEELIQIYDPRYGGKLSIFAKENVFDRALVRHMELCDEKENMKKSNGKNQQPAKIYSFAEYKNKKAVSI